MVALLSSEADIIVCGQVTCAYYGLAFEAGTLPGSLYVTSSLLSLADIPGNALYTAMADHPRIGRQRTQVWLFLGGAVLLFIGFLIAIRAMKYAKKA